MAPFAGRLLLAAACVAAAASSRAEPLSGRLRSAGLAIPAARSYSVRSSRALGAWPGPGSRWAVVASSGAVTLRVHAYAAIEPARAAEIEAEQLDRLRFLYTQQAAYPGVTSRTVHVPDRLLPRFEARGSTGHALVVLFATRTLSYGAASDRLAAYRSVLTFLYCPASRRLFQIESFSPKDEDESASKARLSGLSCALQP